MVLVVFYLQNRLCVNGEMLVPKGLLKSWGVGQNTFQNHSDSHWLHWLLLKLPILPLLGMTRVPPSILWTLTDPGFRKGPCPTEPWIEVPKCPSKLFIFSKYAETTWVSKLFGRAAFRFDFLHGPTDGHCSHCKHPGQAARLRCPGRTHGIQIWAWDTAWERENNTVIRGKKHCWTIVIHH